MWPIAPDAARSVIAVCFDYIGELCKNGATNHTSVRGVDLGGPSESIL